MIVYDKIATNKKQALSLIRHDDIERKGLSATDGKIHYLKIDPAHYFDLMLDNKKAEIRFNDRDYKVGDLLVLFVKSNIPIDSIFHPKAVFKITHILDDVKYLQPGYVMLSVLRVRS